MIRGQAICFAHLVGFVMICSSQSRADLLALGLAVTNLLTGLVWLSIRPKSIIPVNPSPFP